MGVNVRDASPFTPFLRRAALREDPGHRRAEIEESRGFRGAETDCVAFRSKFPVLSSQILLFAPAALLVLGGMLVLRNCLSRPIAHAQDSPDGEKELLIFLEYPVAYPFSGDVRAILEMRRLPEHTPILERELGSYPWVRTAIEEHKVVDWSVPGKIILRSVDGKRRISIPIDERNRPRKASNLRP
jgi:hypothetical protein